MKKDSKEEAEALLPVLPTFPASPAEALEASLVAEAHFQADRSPSPHPVPGVGLVEEGTIQQTPTRSSSECFGSSCRATGESNPM